MVDVKHDSGNERTPAHFGVKVHLQAPCRADTALKQQLCDDIARLKGVWDTQCFSYIVQDGRPAVVKIRSELRDPEDQIDFYRELVDPKKASWDVASRTPDIVDSMMWGIVVILQKGLSAERYAAITEELDGWMGAAYPAPLDREERSSYSDVKANERVYMASNTAFLLSRQQLKKIKSAVDGVEGFRESYGRLMNLGSQVASSAAPIKSTALPRRSIGAAVSPTDRFTQRPQGRQPIAPSRQTKHPKALLSLAVHTPTTSRAPWTPLQERLSTHMTADEYWRLPASIRSNHQIWTISFEPQHEQEIEAMLKAASDGACVVARFFELGVPDDIVRCSKRVRGADRRPPEARNEIFRSPHIILSGLSIRHEVGQWMADIYPEGAVGWDELEWCLPSGISFTETHARSIKETVKGVMKEIVS